MTTPSLRAIDYNGHVPDDPPPDEQAPAASPAGELLAAITDAQGNALVWLEEILDRPA